MTRAFRLLALCAAFALPLSAPAIADRAPTADELAQVEAKLQELGYVRWEEIEHDDSGYWEVDDAVHGNGEVHDLKLDLQTLAVIEREIEG